MAKQKKNKITSKSDFKLTQTLNDISIKVVSAFTIFFFGVLFLASFLQTTAIKIVSEDEAYDNIVNRLRQGVETIIYHNDNILRNLIILPIFFFISIKLLSLVSKLSLKTEIIYICAITTILGMVWVFTSSVSPTEDSYIVTNASLLAAKNDFTFLSDDVYFKRFPYQLGYVLFNELIIRIANLFTETDRLLYLAAINVIFLAALNVAVVLINHYVFSDEKVRHMTVILLTFCLQAIISSSFIYGIIPGFAFAMWALLMQIMYLKGRGGIICPIMSIIFLALAIMLKTNNYIVMIAMVIIGLVTMLNLPFRIRDAVLIVLLVVCSVSVQPTVKAMYEKRSGVDLGPGIPYVAWFAMGLSEAENAPGWYNPYRTVALYDGVDKSDDTVTAESKKYIKERLEKFSEDKDYRNDFFYQKYVSQWNETSYESIWNNIVRGQYSNKVWIASMVCYEYDEKVLKFMDDYAMLVFFGAFAACIFFFKEKDFLAVSMPLVVLGGMLYHLLSEAKSQYALPYFIIMCGIAAYGLANAGDYLKIIREKKMGTWQSHRDT